jgi:hypothetical protein
MDPAWRDLSKMSNSNIINTQTVKKKIEAGQHYFTSEELDAIWWDGYERGALDSAYTSYDQGYAAAIDDYDIYYLREGQGE